MSLRHIGFIMLLACLMFATALVVKKSMEKQFSGKPLSRTEEHQFEEIRMNFRSTRNSDLIVSTSWTLSHCADQNQLEKITETLDLLEAWVWGDKPLDITKLGSLKDFKQRIAQLLKNDDGVIRGFGAITLGVIGDKAYSKDIAKLLKDKHEQPSDILEKVVFNYDRRCAAIALGLLGANEYATNLAILLKSPYADDRLGSSLGLGYMGSKEYVKDIALLLSDNEDHVQISAMTSLSDLGAKEYAKDIAILLDSGGDILVYETACYSLVKLDATDNAKDIASLLNKPFQKYTAAKALALMGAKEYTKDIANLLIYEDSSDKPYATLNRRDILISLGILGAKEYTEVIVKYLKGEDHSYAGLALLLIDAESYASDIVKAVDPDGTGKLDGALEELDDILNSAVVVDEHINKIKARAEKTFQSMRKEVEHIN